MVIVGISGGLGNQMFQYALYEKFRAMDREVYLDKSFYEGRQNIRRFELDLFGVSYQVARRKDIYRLSERYYTPIDKIRRKLFGMKKGYYMEDIAKGYQPEILTMDNIYLDGYWQCETYFSDIRDTIINDFIFPEEISRATQELKSRIKEKTAVSVHVRRGDYLEEKNARIYGGICTVDYYIKAMNWCREKMETPWFYVFTNDEQWCKTHFTTEDIKIIPQQQHRPDYEDMFLMTNCDHHIIANSSFSWWGAWLGRNPEKCVLAPERWFSHYPVSDTICKGWIQISS